VCGSGEATERAMTPDCVCERCLRTVPMSIRRAGPGATLDGGAHPAGRSGCSGRLHPSSQPGQGALRLTNDQGRTAQNVPICTWSEPATYHLPPTTYHLPPTTYRARRRVGVREPGAGLITESDVASGRPRGRIAEYARRTARPNTRADWRRSSSFACTQSPDLTSGHCLIDLNATVCRSNIELHRLSWGHAAW
jgi:hypothetical protein